MNAKRRDCGCFSTALRPSQPPFWPNHAATARWHDLPLNGSSEHCLGQLKPDRLKPGRCPTFQTVTLPPACKTAFFCRDFWNVICIMFRKQRRVRFLKFAVLAAVIFSWLAASAGTQTLPPAYRDDQILIQPKAGIHQPALEKFILARKSEAAPCPRPPSP